MKKFKKKYDAEPFSTALKAGKRIVKPGFILAMLLVASVPEAFASDKGFYAALDGGQSRIGGLCNIFPPTVSCYDTGKVVRLGVGYQFDQTWGVELAYAHLASVGAEGTISATAPNGTPITVPYSAFVRIRGPLLAEVATIPLGKGWSLIQKAGTLRLADINVLVETSNTSGSYSHIGYTSLSLFWGIGTQYDFTSSYSIRAQYENFGTVGNADTGRFSVKALSLGLVYKFYP
jgi:opacity protein-like surface antigen